MLGTGEREKAAGGVKSGCAVPRGKAAAVWCSLCCSSASCWEFAPWSCNLGAEGRAGREQKIFFLNFSAKEMESACMRSNNDLGLMYNSNRGRCSLREKLK